MCNFPEILKSWGPLAPNNQAHTHKQILRKNCPLTCYDSQKYKDIIFLGLLHQHIL